MSFDAGRVSFCRFRVHGDAPTEVDESVLSILYEHRFQEAEIGTPDEVEVGWITGEHLFDVQFTYEKNGYGTGGEAMLLVAMRMDTHKAPSEVKQAYRRINEQSVASGNPSGFASKGQKQEAEDLASRQVREDLAAGKYRKSRTVPVVWDLSRGIVYCGASSNAALEQAAGLLHQSFAVDLERLSAGRLAGEVFRTTGRTRDWEDLHPSPFTRPPAEAGEHREGSQGTGGVEIPPVPWCVQSLDLKDFLGNEWLLWLWWVAEQREGAVEVTDPAGGTGQVFVAIDKALDMDCGWGVRGRQSLRGDSPTRLSEAGEALATGKWPRKAGLILSDGEHQWELTLQADQGMVSACALPEVEDAQSPREIVEQRLRLIRRLDEVLNSAYRAFLTQRGDGGWSTQRQQIRDWIHQRRNR